MINKKMLLTGFGLFISYFTQAQSFKGVYSLGNTTFNVRALSKQDQQDGLFNIVHAKGDTSGTMASLSEHPDFAYVFEEYEGDILLGTFYFTKAAKQKPLEGYYTRQKDKKRLIVKFVKE